MTTPQSDRETLAAETASAPLHAQQLAFGGDVEQRSEWVQDYSGLHADRATVLRPRDEESLRAVIEAARRAARRVTFLGGAQSLGGQCVTSDVLVDLRRFDRVSVDLSRETVVVGGGASWGDIDAALPPAWRLRNVVTTSFATAGGTLVGDSASRWSSWAGREIEGVRRVRVLRGDGVTQELRAGVDDEALQLLAFSGGALGAVIEVEHALVDLRSIASRAHDGRLRVQTIARKHHDSASLLADFANELRVEPSRRHPRGAYALLVPGGRAVLFRSSYTHRPAARRMPNHRHDDRFRPLFEQVIRHRTVGRHLWDVVFDRYYSDGAEFVDDARDFTFFMDASTKSTAVARRFGFATRVAQQLVIVPFDVARDDSVARARGFFDDSERLFRDANVLPLSRDVLAVRGPHGTEHALRYAVAFAVDDARSHGEAQEVLRDHATLAVGAGATIHLAKGVFATAETIARAQGARLVAVDALRRAWDPSGVLRSDFYERAVRPATAIATQAYR